MFKTMSGKEPNYLSDKFTATNSVHRHNLRDSGSNLFIPRPKTEALKKSFGWRGAIAWNALSLEAKHATNISEFINLI